MKNSLFENYSEIQIVLFIVQFFSPLLIVFTVFEGDGSEYSFFGKLAGACLITSIVILWFFGDKVKNVATGRSFKTKSGIKFDEFTEKRTYAPEPADMTMNIVFIHLGITLLVFIIWVIGTF